jgi:hypothetical protein
MPIVSVYKARLIGQQKSDELANLCRLSDTHCAIALYRGISFVCVHFSILSKNGAPDKPGAIQ